MASKQNVCNDTSNTTNIPTNDSISATDQIYMQKLFSLEFFFLALFLSPSLPDLSSLSAALAHIQCYNNACVYGKHGRKYKHEMQKKANKNRHMAEEMSREQKKMRKINKVSTAAQSTKRQIWHRSGWEEGNEIFRSRCIWKTAKLCYLLNLLGLGNGALLLSMKKSTINQQQRQSNSKSSENKTKRKKKKRGARTKKNYRAFDVGMLWHRNCTATPKSQPAKASGSLAAVKDRYDFDIDQHCISIQQPLVYWHILNTSKFRKLNKKTKHIYLKKFHGRTAE